MRARASTEAGLPPIPEEVVVENVFSSEKQVKSVAKSLFCGMNRFKDGCKLSGRAVVFCAVGSALLVYLISKYLNHHL